jgi:hypothetical protein
LSNFSSSFFVHFFMSIFCGSLVVRFFFLFLFSLIWCYNLYSKNTAILYCRSIFLVYVYFPFSYFVIIFCSNLYIIFISVLKVVFLTLYMQMIVGKMGKRIYVRYKFFLYLWDYEFIVIWENIQQKKNNFFYILYEYFHFLSLFYVIIYILLLILC